MALYVCYIYIVCGVIISMSKELNFELRMWVMVVSFPDPIPTRRKGSGVLRAISWASGMQNSHVILIIVMATHCLVCGSRMQQHWPHLHRWCAVT